MSWRSRALTLHTLCYSLLQINMKNMNLRGLVHEYVILCQIKAFVAKHFTKLFVKHKNEVWNFAQAGVFRIVSKTFQQICWICHDFLLFAIYILPDMETGQKHD